MNSSHAFHGADAVAFGQHGDRQNLLFGVEIVCRNAIDFEKSMTKFKLCQRKLNRTRQGEAGRELELEGPRVAPK